MHAKGDLAESLGRNLREFRAVEEQSASEFAARLGLDQRRLEELESGGGNLDLAVLEGIAEEIEIEPVALLERFD